MNKFICNFCPPESTAYPTLASMQQHIKEVHISQRRIGLSPAKIKDVEEAKAKEVPNPSPSQVQTQDTSQPQEKPQRKPILLSYKYTGECQNCGVSVETHQIKVQDGLYMIAWCPNEQKQLKDLKVIPIDEMDKRMMEDTVEEIAIDEERGVWPINKFRGKKK